MIEQLLLDKRLLNPRWVIEPACPRADVGVDAVELGEVDEVHAEGWRDADAPVDRPERRVAAEQIERCAEARLPAGRWPPRPKNRSLPGRSVLTPLGAGRLRPSSSESLTPVNAKNVRLPRTG